MNSLDIRSHPAIRQIFSQKTGCGRRPTSSTRSMRRVRQQIEHELALIQKLGLAGYFLVVWEIVQFCNETGIRVQGQTLPPIAPLLCLGITVDPIGMELLFEDFFQKSVAMADIDLDLPSGDQRERIIQHVYERYGQRGAAMTANVITYRGRSAIRDIGKVLGFEEADLKLSNLISTFEWVSPDDRADKRFPMLVYPSQIH